MRIPTKVKAPKAVPPNLTPEAVYTVVLKTYRSRKNGFIFRIMDDNGHMLFCQERKDNNIMKQDWKIVEMNSENTVTIPGKSR